jgi:cobalt-precorrin 5A hydrolase
MLFSKQGHDSNQLDDPSGSFPGQVIVTSQRESGLDETSLLIRTNKVAEPMELAILVLTRSGLELARRLRGAHPEATAIFGPACVVGRCDRRNDLEATFATEEPGVFGWSGPLRTVFPRVWNEYDAIVAIMALGIVVRLAGPLASDKRRDPAIVVVDDAGRFAISVLGGHRSGANDLAHRVAALLDATPVITTASDSLGVPAADQIGRDHGWSIEWAENLTRVAASIVRRERVAVWQDAGQTYWWRPFGRWPEYFVRLTDWSELDPLHPAALLVITDRVVPAARLLADRTLIYRPPTIVAGVGCKRGTTLQTLEDWTDKVFDAHGLSPRSLAAVATVTLKMDEPGLFAFAAKRGVPLVAFPPQQLDGCPGIETPSARVKAKIGIAAVAEPAALRASGATRLLVAKQKGPGLTIALARRPEREYC